MGERWALLVVREVALGVRRFADIQEATGAPPSVLTDRLRALVQAGVLQTRPYREVGARERLEYVLTAAGRDLQPVLTALMDWGDAHLTDEHGAPVITRHEGCDAPVHAVLQCEKGHKVGIRELRAHARDSGTPGPSSRAADSPKERYDGSGRRAGP